jgi:hypothetical protein
VQPADSYRYALPAAERSGATLVAEHRVCDKCIPPAQPHRIPTPTQQSVSRLDDRAAVVERLSFGEAEPLAARLDQPSVTGQIAALRCGITVYATIELMQPVSADDPQIASGDEGPH